LKGWFLSREEKLIVVPAEDAAADMTKTVRKTTASNPIHRKYLITSLL
jgi:hypothetical protein